MVPIIKLLDSVLFDWVLICLLVGMASGDPPPNQQSLYNPSGFVRPSSMQQEPAPMVNGSTPRPLHPAGGYFSHPSQSFPENPSNMNRSLNPLVPHWARPSTTGQGSAPRWTAPPNNTHENQPSVSQNVRTNGVPLHPTPPNLNLGRPPSAPVISPKSSGMSLVVTEDTCSSANFFSFLEPPLNQFLQNPSQIPPINHREGQFPSSGITSELCCVTGQAIT